MTICIEPMNKEDAAFVADLHIAGINRGFLSSLGPEFVVGLYQILANHKDSLVLVAREEGQVLGFAAFSKNIKSLYFAAAAHFGIRLVRTMGRKLFSGQRIIKMLGTILYPFRKRRCNLPAAELLATAVSPSARGKGIATMLVKDGMSKLAAQGLESIKVLVAADNIPANTLYLKCGFEVVCQTESHGIVSNIAVANLCHK